MKFEAVKLTKDKLCRGFVGTRAEKLGAVARAATVFGEPVERDGLQSFQSLRPDGDSAAVAVNKRMERAAAEYKGRQMVSLRSKTAKANFRSIRSVSVSCELFSSFRYQSRFQFMTN